MSKVKIKVPSGKVSKVAKKMKTPKGKTAKTLKLKH